MSDDSEYAARLLRKYGWKEGEGLGREQQGISKPISVASQKNTEGVGYQSGLFEPWWDSLYDNFAKKIIIPSKASTEATASKTRKSRDRSSKKTRRKQDKTRPAKPDSKPLSKSAKTKERRGSEKPLDTEKTKRSKKDTAQGTRRDKTNRREVKSPQTHL